MQWSICATHNQRMNARKKLQYYLHVLQCTSNITYKQQNQHSTWLIIGKKIRIALFIVACKKKSEENIKELRVSCGKNSNLPPCLCQLRIQAKDFFAPCIQYVCTIVWFYCEDRRRVRPHFGGGGKWGWRLVRARAGHVRRRRRRGCAPSSSAWPRRAAASNGFLSPCYNIYSMLYCYTGKSLDG